MNVLDFDGITPPDFEYATIEAAQYPNILALDPAGYETAETEAMSSYLCRLANTASELTKPYLQNLIVRFLSADKLPKSLAFSSQELHTINGIKLVSARFCEAVNAISQGSINGELLTLSPIKNLADRQPRGLVKPHREWCNECWRDDISNKRSPFIRLYWLIQPVSICCLHNCKLQRFCPKCGLEQNCVPTIPRQWVCDKCGFFLFKSGDDHSGSPAEIWIAHSIYRLMDRVYRQKYRVPANAVQDGIRRLLMANRETCSSLAKRINMPVRILEEALEGKGRPIFPTLVDICYRIDLPIDQFVFDKDILNLPSSRIILDRANRIEKKNLSAQKKLKIGQELKSILHTKPLPPPRISHIAQKHKIEYTVLEYHFPKESSEIRRRWLAWNSDRNLNAAKDRIENLINGVLDLVRHNIYPSDRKLRDLEYVLPSDLRREEILLVLRSLQSSYMRIGLFHGTPEEIVEHPITTTIEAI